jgi:ABC-type multidrug transport system fused ATPase/permease subunit
MKQEGILRQSLEFFSRREKFKLLVITFFQVVISALDLLGVIVLGLIGLSVLPTSGTSTGSFTHFFYQLFHLNSFNSGQQIIFLCLFAAFLLVLRAIISVTITKRILYFLGMKSASLSETMLKRMLSQSIVQVEESSSQASLFAITRGIDYLIMKVIGTGLVLVSDASILIALTIGLFYVSVFSAFSICALFGVTGYVLHKKMGRRAEILGEEFTKNTVLGNEMIANTIESFRELVVHNRIPFLARKMGATRRKLSFVSAELDFQPYVSKYIVESALIVGILSIALFQFLTTDATTTATILTLFIAASVRIAPSALRIQQGLTLIRGSSGMARESIEFMNKLRQISDIEFNDSFPKRDYLGFKSEICVRSLTFKYPTRARPALKNINLDIQSGKITAIIGASGSGKTTLIDALLGLLDPASGFVELSGKSPRQAMAQWAGAISYVPQQVNIIDATIRENVTLGYEAAQIDLSEIERCLQIAGLYEFVLSLPDGLDTFVGENGSKLSGGQKQRLGIARALLTRPRILVLDEATSSLDNKTGGEISSALSKLKGETTIVTVAHRMDTIRNADQIICMSHGEVIATGSYEQISREFPKFIRESVDYDS